MALAAQLTLLKPYSLQTRREYEVEAELDLTDPRRVQHCKIVGFLDVASLDPTAALGCRSLSSCSNMGLY